MTADIARALPTTPGLPRTPRRGGWGERARRRARVRRRSIAVTAVVLAALWSALNPGDASSWIVGAPAVLLGAAVPLLLPPAKSYRVSPVGALRFVAHFARASVTGSLDVTARALRPRTGLAPNFQAFTTRLPPGPARMVFVNVITLLPGTLTADASGARLVIHGLDAGQDVQAELRVLEDRVGDAFRIPRGAEPRP